PDALRAAAAACLCVDPARRISAAAFATFPPALWALHRVEQAAPTVPPRVQLSSSLLRSSGVAQRFLSHHGRQENIFSAVAQNNPEMLRTAIQSLGDTAPLSQLLMEACDKKAYKVMPYLCELVATMKPPIALSWWKGNQVTRKTLPMLAVETQSIEMLERNMDSLCAVYDDCTALMLAAKEGNYQCLMHLLCEMGISSSTGKTALMHAAEGGFSDCVSLLLPEVGKQDDHGLTAYAYATDNGHAACIAILSQYESETMHSKANSSRPSLIKAGANNNEPSTPELPILDASRSSEYIQSKSKIHKSDPMLLKSNSTQQLFLSKATASTGRFIASSSLSPDDPIAMVLSPTKSLGLKQTRLVKSDTIEEPQTVARESQDEILKPLLATRSASQTVRQIHPQTSSAHKKVSRPDNRPHSRERDTLESAILHNNPSAVALRLHDFATNPQPYIDLVFTEKRFKVLPTLCRYLAKKHLKAKIRTRVATPVEELTSLMQAVINGDQQGVKEHMREVDNEYTGWLSYTDASGRGYILSNCTALMIAAAKGDVDCTKYLLCEMGVHLSSKYTALTYAILGGHYECVRLLLLESDISGCTMLMRCGFLNTSEEIPNHLDEAKATIGPGRTALMIAAQLGNKESVKILVDHESGLQDKDGITALYLASSNNQLDCIKILLEREKMIRTNVGWTALMAAAQKGYASSVKLLLEAEGGYQKTDGWTALMLAAQAGHADCASLLVSKEACMAKQDGWTALMIAAQEGHDKVVKVLLKSEAGRQQKTGISALMLAAQGGHDRCVLLLREHEARLVDKRGLTALDYASQPQGDDVSHEKREKHALCISYLQGDAPDRASK
ncbi:Serine/threonine-protein kinase NEK, partial [Giardia duodenalis]